MDFRVERRVRESEGGLAREVVDGIARKSQDKYSYPRVTSGEVLVRLEVMDETAVGGDAENYAKLVEKRLYQLGMGP